MKIFSVSVCLLGKKVYFEKQKIFHQKWTLRKYFLNDDFQENIFRLFDYHEKNMKMVRKYYF